MFCSKKNKNKFVVRRADNFACIGCLKCRGCFGCFRCHRCYNCISCSKSSHTSFSKKCNNCHDSIWLISCNSCYFCFNCVSCIYCYHCKVCTHALASTLCVSCNSIYHCRLCNGISDVQMLFCDDWFFCWLLIFVMAIHARSFKKERATFLSVTLNSPLKESVQVIGRLRLHFWVGSLRYWWFESIPAHKVPLKSGNAGEANQ